MGAHVSHACGAAKRKVRDVADLFAGAGGASYGLKLAMKKLGLQYRLRAVNHWEAAVKTHTANFPEADHYCARVDEVDPRTLFPGRRIDLLIAAPECTDHSNAKGGRPVSDQKRASAWHILRWAELCHIPDILIENVPEFLKWGPVDSRGRKLKSKAGTFFHAFVGALRAAGYAVEWRVLNAADYGDATTRRRLFIMARKSRPIVWPTPTHAEFPTGHLKPWRAAAEIIDWSLPGTSIFDRERHGLPPLKPTTLGRILEGVRRYGPREIYPFLVQMFGTGKTRKVTRPLSTVTAGGKKHGLAQPFVLSHRQFQELCVDPVTRPKRTITSKSTDEAIAQGVIVATDNQGGNGKYVRSTKEPLYTLTTRGQQGVAVILGNGGPKGSAIPRTALLPLKTITSGATRYALSNSFLLDANHGRKVGRDGGRVHDIRRPVKTLSTQRGMAIVSAFIDKFYGTGVAQPVTKPLDTVTVKPRFGLVEVAVNRKPVFYFTILFRMLQPHELAAAMGFPKGYFADPDMSKEDVVKMIGNAWPVHLGAALCEAMLR